MPDPTSFTNPLSGHEIVADVLGQIRKRLATDCNLRATDGYSGGYSGTVSIKLKLHAVRVTEVNMEIPITDEIKEPAIESFSEGELIPAEIEQEIEIPLEPNLQEVRQRTADSNDEAQSVDDPTSTEPKEEAPSTMTQKRKYTRRAAIAGAVSE